MIRTGRVKLGEMEKEPTTMVEGDDQEHQFAVGEKLKAINRAMRNMSDRLAHLIPCELIVTLLG